MNTGRQNDTTGIKTVVLSKYNNNHDTTVCSCGTFLAVSTEHKLSNIICACCAAVEPLADMLDSPGLLTNVSQIVVGNGAQTLLKAETGDPWRAAGCILCRCVGISHDKSIF